MIYHSNITYVLLYCLSTSSVADERPKTPLPLIHSLHCCKISWWLFSLLCYITQTNSCLASCSQLTTLFHCCRLLERPLTGPLARRMAASIDDLAVPRDVPLKVVSPSSASCSVIDRLAAHPHATAPMGSSSCLTAKLRAMSEKYLKCSTNRFLAKLYKTKPDSEVPKSPTCRKAKLR